MKRLRLLLVLPLLLMMMMMIGCKDPYGACVKAGADIATGIGQGMHAVDSLRQQGVVSVAEESNILGYLKFANDADKAFLTCAQTAHTSGNKAGSFTACAQGFATALNNPTELALIKVSSANGSQQVSVIVNGITTGITAVTTALGGA